MSLDSDLPTGFQVKYLGSVSFTRKRRRALKGGIGSLQRPLLELYTGARRRGESHRSAHPLALTQALEICDYGLVVAEGRGETVVTKVVTPLSNVVLWAAVRFHARIIKRRVFGAAFVPLACSDGALDPKSYVCLASKQRFLVSLTHPSVFACLYRCVARPTVFECHAFVCATAEDAVALAGLAGAAARREAERPPRPLLPHRQPTGRRRRRAAPSLDSSCYSPSDATTPGYRPPGDDDPLLIPGPDTEEESNSYASLFQRTPVVGRRGGGPPPARRHAAPGRPRPRVEQPPLRHQDGRRATLRELPPPFPLSAGGATEVLAETIDLSSERSSGSSASAGWRPLPRLGGEGPPPPVKYTYFGFETFARPPHMTAAASTERRRRTPRPGSGPAIHGNGTGRVTIAVAYRPDSRASSSSCRSSGRGAGAALPRGVRSFHAGGRVRDWSSLSRGPSSSSSAASSLLSPAPPRSAQGPPKAIRWSSEDALPLPPGRQGGFFWSLKRLGMQSLTKAKHKTGKFISTVRTRLMRGAGKRSSADGSEDSAYDTSEVCLSPSGRAPGPSSSAAPRRQQSWSFHDLRTAGLERPRRKQPQQHHHHRRKQQQGACRRKQKKGAGRSSSSSDSGVEAACHSDQSDAAGGVASVTRVAVRHGMGPGTFQRWSRTNMQDELGYIP